MVKGAWNDTFKKYFGWWQKWTLCPLFDALTSKGLSVGAEKKQ